MVGTSFRLPHPAPDRIIAAADRKQPASMHLVGTTLSAFLPIPLLPYPLLKEPRIDVCGCFAVCAATETTLYAMQSPSGEFSTPFAPSVKPLRQLSEPLGSTAAPIRYYLYPLSKRCNAHPAISGTPLHPVQCTLGSFRNPFLFVETPNRLY
jgi:hypothetical protein